MWGQTFIPLSLFLDTSGARPVHGQDPVGTPNPWGRTGRARKAA